MILLFQNIIKGVNALHSIDICGLDLCKQNVIISTDKFYPRLYAYANTFFLKILNSETKFNEDQVY